MSKEVLTIIKTETILGKEFNIYGSVENPLILARDVASWIEHSKPRDMVSNVDEDEKIKMPFKVATSRSTQEQWFLTEYGVYEVLMQSRKPIAKEVKGEIKYILKKLRLEGVVITDIDKATDEVIEYNKKLAEMKFGNIEKYIRESDYTNLEARIKALEYFHDKKIKHIDKRKEHKAYEGADYIQHIRKHTIKKLQLIQDEKYKDHNFSNIVDQMIGYLSREGWETQTRSDAQKLRYAKEKANK